MKCNTVLTQLIPPILLNALKRLHYTVNTFSSQKPIPSSQVSEQDLDMYWDPKTAIALEAWGEGTAWDEIKYLLVNLQGNIIDIACGTGKNIEMNSFVKGVEIFGCDISDALINKARERGIPEYRLQVCDATHTDYLSDQFDYGYSIGSLEHFTEVGIDKFMEEVNRIVSKRSFHMIPVSRSMTDEGWLKLSQSYHNNSVAWWKNKFDSHFSNVYILDSRWSDIISEGKWFICDKKV